MRSILNVLSSVSKRKILGKIFSLSSCKSAKSRLLTKLIILITFDSEHKIG